MNLFERVFGERTLKFRRLPAVGLSFTSTNALTQRHSINQSIVFRFFEQFNVANSMKSAIKRTNMFETSSSVLWYFPFSQHLPNSRNVHVCAPWWTKLFNFACGWRTFWWPINITNCTYILLEMLHQPKIALWENILFMLFQGGHYIFMPSLTMFICADDINGADDDVFDDDIRSGNTTFNISIHIGI